MVAQTSYLKRETGAKSFSDKAILVGLAAAVYLVHF